jgi:hypothetical protein
VYNEYRVLRDFARTFDFTKPLDVDEISVASAELMQEGSEMDGMKFQLCKPQHY